MLLFERKMDSASSFFKRRRDSVSLKEIPQTYIILGFKTIFVPQIE